MTSVITIDDPDDERLRPYRHLTDAELRRGIEQPGGGRTGCFIAEGTMVIRQLLASGYRVRSLLLAPRKVTALAADLDGIDVEIYVATAAVMDAVAGFVVHRGALALADRRPLPMAGALLHDSRRVAVLEGINDHENLGAVFRNAAAFGIDAVFLCPRCCDPLYRRSVRVSAGHVLRVPYARLEPWPAALSDIRQAGFVLVGLTPAITADAIDRLDAPGRVALLLGAEGPGLSPEALAAADRLVRIPMSSGVDSINVATAAAIAFHRLATGGVAPCPT